MKKYEELLARLNELTEANKTADLTEEVVAEMEQISSDMLKLRADRATEAANSINESTKKLSEPEPVAVAEPVAVVETVTEPEPVETVTEPVLQVVEVAEPVAVVETVTEAPLSIAAAAVGTEMVIEKDWSMVAAAGVGTPVTGLESMVEAFNERARALPRGGSTDARYGVAQIDRGDSMFTSVAGNNLTELVASATDEQNLPGGSLVAAGGWCAPSETIYDVCNLVSTDDVISLPSVPLNRGGVKYVTGPDFSVLFGGLFTQTEAENIAGVEKTCLEVPCLTPEEVRAEMVGLCLTSAIMQDHAWPELTKAVLEGQIAALEHKIGEIVIERMLATMTTATGVVDQNSTTQTFLQVVGALAQKTRYKNRLANRTTIEVVAPAFAKELIIGDLAKRAAGANTWGWFMDQLAARNVSVQWVKNWQDLTGDCDATMPTSFDIMVYPAGTYVMGRKNIISLDAVFDAASLKKNLKTAAFVEDAIAIIKKCGDGCVATIPVCTSGRMGANDLVACA